MSLRLLCNNSLHFLFSQVAVANELRVFGIYEEVDSHLDNIVEVSNCPYVVLSVKLYIQSFILADATLTFITLESRECRIKQIISYRTQKRYISRL